MKGEAPTNCAASSALPLSGVKRARQNCWPHCRSARLFPGTAARLVAISSLVDCVASRSRSPVARAASIHCPKSPSESFLALAFAPPWFGAGGSRLEPGGPALPFALCLAGHTHGGQIRLPFLPPYVPQGAGPRFVAGWYAQTRQGPAYISGQVHWF